MESEIHVVGGIKKSDACPHCMVDIETGVLLPCNLHAIKIKHPSPKKTDKKNQLIFDLKL